MTRSWRASACAWILGACGAAIPTMASPMFFASEDNILFRYYNGVLDDFTMPDFLTGLDFDERGTLWGVGTDHDNDGKYELYRINDPYGTPTLELVSEGLTRPTPSIVWEGSTLYGIQGGPTDPPQTLVTINPATGVATAVGTTGDTGITPRNVGGITIKDGEMWALNCKLPGELYTIDYHLQHGANPTATFATFTRPLAMALLTDGLDVDPTSGDIYALIRNANLIGPDLGIYRVDEETGDLDLDFDLSTWTAVRGASGFAVIPEPTVGLLLAAGAMLLARRRSRAAL